MNRTLSDIDKSLSETKTKMKSDFERSLRGLNFGKLYLKNGEYETALKYVKSFLGVRPNSSEGHKLLAHIYEAIGENETALINYRKSLDLKKNSNENFLSSIQSPITTPSMSENNRNIENNSFVSVESTPVRKEKLITTDFNENKSHPSGTCSNQSVLNKIVKQNENLMETNKMILDVLQQNTSNMHNIQKQMVCMSEALNNLTDSQNLMKDSLYDYMAQEEHEDFDDYLLDDKENESLDTSVLLGVGNQSDQWQNSSLQLIENRDQNKPLSELFKPAADSWQCQACYVQNNPTETTCAACTTPKPGATVQPSAPEPVKTTFGFGNAQPFSFKAPVPNSNSGFSFGLPNAELKTSVESNTIFSNTNFKFGNSSFNNSLSSAVNPPQFGLQSSKPNDIQNPQNIFSLNPNSSESKPNSFQFGLKPNFDFEFPKQMEKNEEIKTSNIFEEKVTNEREDENTSLNDSFVEPSNADNIYFQPVVPLPPKIEVKTGEEDEKVVHTCRAKLFRFCDNEWKERGVGELKILESTDSTRIRILMRRDTIFKVCLNQYITPDLKLDLKDDKKTISWSAIDYSEDTPIPQIFLLRLKNAENAQLFLNAIETAKSALKTDDSFEVCPQPIASTDHKEQSNIESSIKTSIDSNINTSNDDIEIVYQKMPESEEILKKVRDLKLPINFYDYENMNPCPGCRGCVDDDTPLFLSPGPKPLQNKLNETSDPTQESLFHSAIAATNISPTDWSTAKVGQHLWANTPTPIFSSPRSPSQDDEIVANPDIYFKPLIPLPDLVEVKTGEEDETPIYCQRAKLYRFDPQIKEWKERGIGDFKILKHNSKNRFRMVLRREQIYKIACNHYISSAMTLKPMNTSETAVCWYAIDYTEGNALEEQFALKFKNKDILQVFTKLFNECKSNLDENDLNQSYNEETNDFNGTQTEGEDKN